MSEKEKLAPKKRSSRNLGVGDKNLEGRQI